MKNYLTDYQVSSTASVEEFKSLEGALNFSFPTEYKEFLQTVGAGEGFVGNEYLIMWEASELIEFNEDYEVEKYASNLFLFGSNGGGEAFYFDKSSLSKEIGIVPFIGMSSNHTKAISTSFREFLEKLHNPNEDIL